MPHTHLRAARRVVAIALAVACGAAGLGAGSAVAAIPPGQNFALTPVFPEAIAGAGFIFAVGPSAAYVSTQDGVAVVDLADGRVRTTLPYFYEMEVDPARNRVWTKENSTSRLVAYDGTTDEVVATSPVGYRGNLEVDESDGTLWLKDSCGFYTSLDPDTFEITSQVSTRTNACKAFTVDSATGFLVNTVDTGDTVDNISLVEIVDPKAPADARGYTPSTFLDLTPLQAGGASRIGKELTGLITRGGKAYVLSLSPCLSLEVVCLSGRSDLVTIDLAARAVTGSVRLPDQATGFTLDPDADIAYVSIDVRRWNVNGERAISVVDLDRQVAATTALTPGLINGTRGYFLVRELSPSGDSFGSLARIGPTDVAPLPLPPPNPDPEFIAFIVGLLIALLKFFGLS